ncbi:flagellar protein FlgN [Cytobacillus firmus]|uniref:FlgN protein n=1 Tax=Cytobacillus firmus TaxID=1399 RepID=A0A800MZ06_CYTFI|nr:flagellar protein FlgN [Cytobacillus firmus]KAF0825032.1 hypothetical protein KIS1582_1234 [Cytobacillus firmus]
MSAEQIQHQLQNLVLLYKSLNQLAQKKTEIIKKGDADALNTLMLDEQKHLKGIQTCEKQLLDEAKGFLQEQGFLEEHPSLDDCISHSVSHEKEILLNLKNELQEQVDKLKQQNDLNQQLLEQSLQFVNMSLDLLMPSIDSFNYDHPGGAQDLAEEKRSIFDSKA